MAFFSRAGRLFKPTRWMRSGRAKSRKETSAGTSTDSTPRSAAVTTAVVQPRVDAAPSPPLPSPVASPDHQSVPLTSESDFTSTSGSEDASDDGDDGDDGQADIAGTASDNPTNPSATASNTPAGPTNQASAAPAVTHGGSTDTDISNNDVAAAGTTLTQSSLFGTAPPAFTDKFKSWGAPNPATLRPQLFLDISKMTPFAAPSGRPFGSNPEPADSSDVFTFSGAAALNTALNSSGPGLIYARKYADEMVTLKVGAEAFPFRVHKSILTESSKVFRAMFDGPFKDSVDKETVLDEDDPNAWGLILDWLYTGNLPVFHPVWMKSSVRISQSTKPHGPVINIPLPSYFGNPTATHETIGGVSHPVQAVFQHICTQENYAKLSAEELRLVEGFPNNPELVVDYVAYLNGGGSKDASAMESAKAEARNTMEAESVDEDSKKTLQAVLEHLVREERIPMPVPFPTYIEAEFLQVTLVKLMIAADKYCWDDLFNDAMDAYRKGEELLGRRHPVLRHIELAYSHCHRQSPLIQLMADLAFFMGKANNTQSELVEVGTLYPEFLEDLMKRHDRKVTIAGYDHQKESIKFFRSPLSKAGGMYHRHMSQKGEPSQTCPASCDQRKRDKESNLAAT